MRLNSRPGCRHRWELRLREAVSSTPPIATSRCKHEIPQHLARPVVPAAGIDPATGRVPKVAAHREATNEVLSAAARWPIVWPAAPNPRPAGDSASAAAPATDPARRSLDASSAAAGAAILAAQQQSLLGAARTSGRNEDGKRAVRGRGNAGRRGRRGRSWLNFAPINAQSKGLQSTRCCR